MKWHDEIEKIWNSMISQHKEFHEEPEMPENRTDLALDEMKHIEQYEVTLNMESSLK